LPVTAKLSRRFYETFGDEIANELVEWFNQVDATYRADLIQLNELNFARFDASMGERFARQDAKWERRVAELETKWERRFGELDTKWERRLVELDTKWGRRLAELDTKWGGRATELVANVDGQIASLRVDMARLRADLTRWMFVFWAGTVVPLAALVLALSR